MARSLQSTSNGFTETRKALMAAFQRYDELAKSQTGVTQLAIAEHEMLLASQALTRELTTPGEFALDVWLMGVTRHSAIVIAIEMGIFEIVTESIDIEELSNAIKSADKALLHRIMRILTSLGIFTQTADERYHSTKFSRKLTEPSARGWVQLARYMSPPIFANAEALRRNNWRASTNPLQSGVGIAYGQSLFDILQKDEAMRSVFDVAMPAQDDLPREQHPDTRFPYVKFLDGLDNDHVAFVDVGGGNGHVMRKIKSEHPDIKGRFVLLEMPDAIAAVRKEEPPFECLVGNFFEPLSIKGAQNYHIRRCLHDWGNEQCETILKNIREAMTPGFSRLLIHEFVLPATSPRESRSHMLDVVMMALSGQERDEREWQQLLDRSGLRLVKVWRAEIGDMAIVEAMVA